MILANYACSKITAFHFGLYAVSCGSHWYKFVFGTVEYTVNHGDAPKIIIYDVDCHFFLLFVWQINGLKFAVGLKIG